MISSLYKRKFILFILASVLIFNVAEENVLSSVEDSLLIPPTTALYVDDDVISMNKDTYDIGHIKAPQELVEVR